MDLRLPNGRLQPGMRFAPTHEELAVFYLKRKVLGKKLYNEVITEVDIYRYAPWDLPDMACACLRKELMWHFFCPRSKKYATGGRANRATECGYWKATGNDRVISYKKRTVAKIKTLIFHEGKPPKGKRTDWVMHEYRLDDQKLADQGIVQDTFVLCKVFHKRGWGPQNGVEYAAPFIEEEWEDISEVADPDAAVNPTAAVDNQKYSATDNLNVPASAVCLKKYCASALDSGSTDLVTQPSVYEKVYSEAFSGVIEHLGLASPTPLSCHPSTTEEVYSETVSGVIEQPGPASSTPAFSYYPSTSEQGCAAAGLGMIDLAPTPASKVDAASTSKIMPTLDSETVSGVIEQPGPASSTPAFSYYPSTSEQGCAAAGLGMIDLAPTPASKVDAASTSKIMPTLDCDDDQFTAIYEGLEELFDWEGGLDLDDLDGAIFP